MDDRDLTHKIRAPEARVQELEEMNQRLNESRWDAVFHLGELSKILNG